MFSAVSVSLIAQDKVRFSNGKELECKIEGASDTTVWVTKTKGKKTKEAIFSNKEVFSIVYKDSIEVVLYKPDASDEKAFSVDQMRSYVAGEAFARRNYKGCIATGGSFISGVGGGLLGFWGLLVPLIYDISVSSYRPSPRNYRNEVLPATVDDFFILGYQDVAQKKKTHNVIKGSVIGVVGIVLYTTLMSK